MFLVNFNISDINTLQYLLVKVSNFIRTKRSAESFVFHISTLLVLGSERCFINLASSTCLTNHLHKHPMVKQWPTNTYAYKITTGLWISIHIIILYYKFDRVFWRNSETVCLILITGNWFRSHFFLFSLFSCIV